MRYGWRMNNSVRVAILGSSVIMAGIAHALRAQDGITVCVVGCTDELQHLFEQSCPDILIFDLAAVTVDDVRPLLRGHGARTFIGIDIAGRQALTLSSRTCPLSTLDDLAHLIDLSAMVAVTAPGCVVRS